MGQHGPQMGSLPLLRKHMKKIRKKRRKTIKRDELHRLSYCNSAKLPRFINDEGVRKEWIGIGWIDFKEKLTGHEVKVID